MRVGIGLEITRGSQQAGGATGATLALDFQRSQYSAAGANYGNPANLPGWSFVRASVGWAKDSLGNDIQFLSGVPRITDLGLLVEATRTNFLLNSTAPVTQTTGSLATGTYTLWIVGTGSAAITAGTGTATGLGTATAASPVTITVTVAGTFTVTNTGSVTFFQLENGAGVTSRIVTAGATATRASDVASITGLATQAAATWLAVFKPMSVGSYSRIIAGPVAGPNVVTPLLVDTGGLGKVQAYDSGDIAVTGNTVNLNATNKAAMAYDGTGTSVVLNGGTVATGAAGADFAGLTFIYIGTNSTTAATNGYYAQITQTAGRSANAQLQAMTT